MTQPWDWHIEMEPGAICRTVVWGKKEVALVNPCGDFTDETERDLAAGIAFSARMHKMLRELGDDASLALLPNHLREEIHSILRGIENIDTGSYQEIDQ